MQHLSSALAHAACAGDGQYAGLGFTSVLDFLMNSDAAEVATSVAVAAASGLATSALLGNPSLVSVALIPTNQVWSMHERLHHFLPLGCGVSFSGCAVPDRHALDTYRTVCA